MLNTNKAPINYSSGLVGYAAVAKTVKHTKEEAKDDILSVSDGMASILLNKFGDNISAGSAYVSDAFDKMLSEASVGSPDTQAELASELNKGIYDNLVAQGREGYANKIMEQLYQQEIGSMTLATLDSKLRSDMNSDTVVKESKKAAKKSLEALKLKDPNFISWFNKLGKDAQDAYVKGMEDKAINYGKNKVKNILWQQFYIKRGVTVDKSDTEYIAFVKKQQEELGKKLQEVLSQAHKLKTQFGIDVDIDLNSKDAVKKMMQLILNINKVIHDTWLKHNAVSGKKREDKMREINFLRDMRSRVNMMRKLAKALQDDHQSLGGNDSSKSSGNAAERARNKEERARNKEERARNKAETAKRKAEAAARKADRDWMNRERHYIQSLGDAYRMYKMWYKDLQSEPAAIKRVRDAYGDVLHKTDFKDITSIAGYQGLLNKERQKIANHKFNYNSDMSDDRKGLITDVTKTVNDLFHDAFTESSEKFTSDMEKTLERITDAFKTFEDVLKATGDESLADKMTKGLTGLLGEENLVVGKNSISFGEEDATKIYMPLENVADAFKNRMLENLTSITGRSFYGAHQFKEGFMETSDYLFDENASKEDIEKRVGFLFNVKNEDGKYDELMQKLIPAVNKLILEWQKLAKAEREKAIKLYSDSINKLSDYKSIASRNNADYNTSISSNNLLEKLGLISKEKKDMANRRAEGIRDEQNFKATIAFSKYFGNVLAMTRKEAIETAEVLKNQLNEKLATGRVSASEYAKEMQKIQDVLDKKKQNTFFGSDSDIATFIQGGIPALQKRVQGQIEDKRSELAKSYENSGLSKEEIDKRINENGDLKKLLGKSDFLNGMVKGLGDMSLAISLVTGTLDGLNAAAKSLSDMFDALGDEGKANLWSDVSDTIGGISSIFSPVSDIAKNAMSGNVGGIVSSAISAPFKMIASPIAAFSRLHDKKIDRHIEKLKESVSRIEGYTEVISRAQERTLGYDNGDLLRMYQRQYEANNYQLKFLVARFTMNKEGAAGKAMSDYYKSAGGSDVNGYQQQLNLLKQQRQDYIGMYNDEDRKKKKSKASLEEYKQKIAELDDKIIHFSEDLAKNLWGIDLKSWADQISDALVTAFENGENAANAYQNAVEDIMRSVVRNVIRMGVLEPMMEKLRRKLFGFTDGNGKYHSGVINLKDEHAWDDPKKSAGDIVSMISDFMGTNGPMRNAIVAVQEMWNGLEKSTDDTGISLRKRDNKTLSSDIQGTSEETSALFAGYINALRQDVSYIRLMQTQFINEAFPDYVKQITGMATTLGRIDANVAAIRSIISENGALYEKVERLSDDLHNVIIGNQKLHIA
ncbi:hypothetical protein [Prevotella corporis]|uniref:hypothetical protein n=1 Tax=Prevotella corporis TaxID=28128 RepID=UPI0023F16158|nr:hypothetical protein [Prevotella corporis]